jgi:hypothetical protein
LFDRPGTEPTGVPAVNSSGNGESPVDPQALADWMTEAALPIAFEGQPASAPAVMCHVTAAEVDELLPEPTGLAPDRQVCVAEAPGDYTTSAPVDPQLERQPQSLAADTAFAVVDAETGNLLLAGAYRRS